MSVIDFGTEQYDEFEQRAIRRRRSRGELVRIRPGVFAADEPTTAEVRHRQLVIATMPRIADDSMLSHVSAAVLHGLPVLRSRLGPVTVTRQRSNGRRSAHLHARRAPLAEHECTLIDGVPVTSLARTVSDLARTLPFGEALAAADFAVRSGTDLRSELPVDQLPLRVRRVVHSASPLSESIGESMSRAVFIRAGVPPATLQFEVREPWGDLVGRCDFGWPTWNVVGEFDGDVKYAGTLAGSHDPTRAIIEEKRREERIRDCGFDVVRWGWATMREPSRLVARVVGALEVRGYRFGR